MPASWKKALICRQSGDFKLFLFPAKVPTVQELCANFTLEPQYLPYLDTSFLGLRRSTQVGTVDYSYYQFGPLNVSSANAGIAVGVRQHLSAPAFCVTSLFTLPALRKQLEFVLIGLHRVNNMLR